MGNNVSQYKLIVVYITRLFATQATYSTIVGTSMSELEGAEKEEVVAYFNAS